MSLGKYWPEEQAILDCVPTEAEGLDRALARFTHQPMRLQLHTNLADATSKETPGEIVGEERVFEELTAGMGADGFLIIPILGDSGAGKSHLVRNVEFRLLEDDRWVVIRVKKSATVRGILEQMAKALSVHGVNDLGKLVEKAGEKLFKEDVPKELRRQIEKRLDILERSAKGNPDDEFNRIVLKFGKLMNLLLHDPVFGQDLLSHVLKDMAHDQVLSGPQSGQERREFTPSDLEFKHVNPEDVPKASLEARQAFTRTQRESFRRDATRLLNAAAKNAWGVYLQESANLDLVDVLVEARKRLHAQGKGKEFVFLIEDGKALEGIADLVTRFLIDDRSVDQFAKGGLCPIRTLFATTEGVLNIWNTVATRGRRIIWVPNVEEQDKERTVCMLARYLNAARFGREGVSHLENEPELPVWGDAESLDEEEQRQLEAFGYADVETGVRVPLFPLSHSLVNAWTKRSTTPRDLLKTLLHDLLKQHKRSWREHRFPDHTAIPFTTLQPEKMAPEFAQFREGRSRDETGQFRMAFSLWGPSGTLTLENLGVDQLDELSRIFVALHLDPGVLKPRGTPSKVDGVQPPEHDPVAGDGRTRDANIWRTRLSGWATGRSEQKLVGRDHQRLRRWVFELGEARTPWDELPGVRATGSEALDAADLFLPNAEGGSLGKGQDPGRAYMALDLDAAAEQQMKAVALACGVYQGGGYDGCLEDWGYLGALSLHVSEAMKEHHSRRTPTIPLDEVAHTLYWSGRVLGYVSPEDQALEPDERLFYSVFHSGTPTRNEVPRRGLGGMQPGDLEHRKTVRSWLAREVGFRSTDRLSLIDAARVLEIHQRAQERPRGNRRRLQARLATNRLALDHLWNAVITLPGNVEGERRAWAEALEVYAGVIEGTDLSKLLEELGALSSELNFVGRTQDQRDLSNASEQLRRHAAALMNIELPDEDAPLELMITRMDGLDRNARAAVVTACVSQSTVLDRIEARTLTDEAGDRSVNELAVAHARLLDELERINRIPDSWERA